MIGVFGSMARGDAKKGSDIDLIVRSSKRKSLLSVVRLERELTEALGRKVDLLTVGALSPYLLERILKVMKAVYEKLVCTLNYWEELSHHYRHRGTSRANGVPEFLACYHNTLYHSLSGDILHA